MFVAARRPDPTTAYKNLKRHMIMLGLWVGFVRALPYALQAIQDSKRKF